MEFERIIEGKDFLWAVRDADKEVNELTELFRKWNDLEYLMDFFKQNQQDLKEFFHIERISQAINDTMEDSEVLEGLILEMPYCENLDELFRPLGEVDSISLCLHGKKPGIGCKNVILAGFVYMLLDWNLMSL